jgi:YidC/Oxa1 family membrane protein insertase
VKEMSTERRIALAFALWLVILIGWNYVWRPSKPVEPPAPQSSAPATPATPAEQKPAAEKPAAKAPAPAAKTRPAPAPTVIAATQEKILEIENGHYRVELSNRGGVVKSWRLKNYKDHQKEPLELVNAQAAQQVGAWPFSLAVDDPALEAQINGALFEMTPGEGPLKSPAEINFAWSDGHVQVTKRLKFDAGYVVVVESSVLVDGQPVAHGVAWRGGFGDVTEFGHFDQVKVIFRENQKLNTLEAKKLGVPDHNELRQRQIGTMQYAGIEDRYFAAAFLPRSDNPAQWNAGMTLWHWRLEREIGEGDKRGKESVVEMAAGSTVPGPVAFRVYVGPKALDELRAQKPPLTELVQFGWLGFIAEPLFYFLRWIYGYVPNYGWAIILMTIAINMALFPLKVKSWRSMQKMQKVMPEIKQIQDRYKKYSMKDPRRQDMNNEVMAVYKREGVNPMGSCLPMLLQMPIWIALFSMLGAAIELRHAPWLGWVQDLSSRDPYYILPILMTVTMYISQKMTPATSADPAQQKMMQMMPIIFGFLFMRTSSGLTLYILSSNIVAMGQQWYLNKTTPPSLNGNDKKPGKKSGGGDKAKE